MLVCAGLSMQSYHSSSDENQRPIHLLQSTGLHQRSLHPRHAFAMQNDEECLRGTVPTKNTSSSPNVKIKALHQPYKFKNKNFSVRQNELVIKYIIPSDKSLSHSRNRIAYSLFSRPNVLKIPALCGMGFISYATLLKISLCVVIFLPNFVESSFPITQPFNTSRNFILPHQNHSQLYITKMVSVVVNGSFRGLLPPLEVDVPMKTSMGCKTKRSTIQPRNCSGNSSDKFRPNCFQGQPEDNEQALYLDEPGRVPYSGTTWNKKLSQRPNNSGRLLRKKQQDRFSKSGPTDPVQGNATAISLQQNNVNSSNLQKNVLDETGGRRNSIRSDPILYLTTIKSLGTGYNINATSFLHLTHTNISESISHNNTYLFIRPNDSFHLENYSHAGSIQSTALGTRVSLLDGTHHKLSESVDPRDIFSKTKQQFRPTRGSDHSNYIEQDNYVGWLQRSLDESQNEPSLSSLEVLLGRRVRRKWGQKRTSSAAKLSRFIDDPSSKYFLKVFSTQKPYLPKGENIDAKLVKSFNILSHSVMNDSPGERNSVDTQTYTRNLLEEIEVRKVSEFKEGRSQAVGAPSNISKSLDGRVIGSSTTQSLWGHRDHARKGRQKRKSK